MKSITNYIIGSRLSAAMAFTLSAAGSISSGLFSPARTVSFDAPRERKHYPFSSTRQDRRIARTQVTRVVNGFPLMQTLPSKDR